MPAPSLVQNPPPPSLRRKVNQLNDLHGDEPNEPPRDGTSNLRQLTSNPIFLLPKPTLWFQIAWGDLIIMPLIMVMLTFPLHSLQLSITLNQFYIQTPLLLNQLMMMKWIIYCNFSIQNMMNIFWMFKSRCFKLYWL